MLLSIVTTVYQSEDTILEFYSSIVKTAQSIVGDDYEIIIVNDGSEDSSLSLIKELHSNDPKVSIVDLSKNFHILAKVLYGFLNNINLNISLIFSNFFISA